MARPPITRLNENVAEFRDDDRTGWKMRLVLGSDGDFHVSVIPDWRDMEEDDREVFKACYGGSVRVRMPMIGGGDHEALYAALAKLWHAVEKSPIPAARTTEEQTNG